MTEPDLDDLFAAARAATPEPPAALRARVLADAIAEQQKPLPRPVLLQRRTAWFDRLAELFGGGGALAGVSLALVAGVFVGIVQPAPVAALTSALLTQAQLDSVDLLPATAALWEDEPDD